MEGGGQEDFPRVRNDCGLEALLQQQKALEYHLSHLKEERANYVKTLPDLTRRRILALKKLQKEFLLAEASFYEEIHRMACRLQKKLSPIYNKREAIINGSFTPNDADLYISDEEDTSEELPSSNNPSGFVDNGIPDFWLTVLKANSTTADLILPHDEPVLSKLTNIHVTWVDFNPLGFTLEFHFAPNEYFSNKVLYKNYTLKFRPQPHDLFSYEGPEISQSKGCSIDWYKGKNVTVKTVRKKQKHRGGSMTRTVTKVEKVPSFFNFFSPPKIPDDVYIIDEDLQEELNIDFEIGHFMKDQLIPRAVLYYTGEALEDESSGESDEYEESEEDELEDADVVIKDLIEETNSQNAGDST